MRARKILPAIVVLSAMSIVAIQTRPMKLRSEGKDVLRHVACDLRGRRSMPRGTPPPDRHIRPYEPLRPA